MKKHHEALARAGIFLDGAKSLGIKLPDDLAPKKKPKVQARYSKPKAEGMTGLEKDFSKLLENRRIAGEIWRWELQTLKLQLVAPVSKTEVSEGIKGSWYTPDFVVYENDGTISLYETKGYLDINADGFLKFKTAISKYPFAFYLAHRPKKEWNITRLK